MENIFEIVYDVTENDIKQMIMLDNSSYISEDDSGDLEICLSWKKICPELYTVLKIQDEIIGYINFIPLTKDCYNQFRNGKKKDYELNLTDILPFKKGYNYCLFMSIVVKEEYRKTGAVKVLLEGFYNKIQFLNSKGIFIKSVLSDCVSDGGEKISKNMKNSKFICLTSTGSKIYEFEL